LIARYLDGLKISRHPSFAPQHRAYVCFPFEDVTIKYKNDLVHFSDVHLQCQFVLAHSKNVLSSDDITAFQDQQFAFMPSKNDSI
jgi:hypothetical protein